MQIKDLEQVASIDEGVIKRLNGARFKTADPGNGIKGGVKVVEIAADSPAASSGLEENDIIVSINRQTITSLKRMKEVVKFSTEVLLIKLIRNKRALFLVIQ